MRKTQTKEGRWLELSISQQVAKYHLLHPHADPRLYGERFKTIIMMYLLTFSLFCSTERGNNRRGCSGAMMNTKRQGPCGAETYSLE